MDYKFMHPAEQIVQTINRIYRKQMTTTSGGNLSIIDSDGNIWITPSGIDTLVNPLHEANAFSPILSTLSGMDILFKLLHL